MRRLAVRTWLSLTALGVMLVIAIPLESDSSVPTVVYAIGFVGGGVLVGLGLDFLVFRGDSPTREWWRARR